MISQTICKQERLLRSTSETEETKFSPHQRQLESISLLLSNDTKILDIILSDDRQDLRYSEEKSKEAFEGFSDGQQLLVRIALDIWSLSGNSNLSEILFRLDPIRSEAFLMAMNRMMTNPVDPRLSL